MFPPLHNGTNDFLKSQMKSRSSKSHIPTHSFLKQCFSFKKQGPLADVSFGEKTCFHKMLIVQTLHSTKNEWTLVGHEN